MIRKILKNVVVYLFLIIISVGIAVSQSVGIGDAADFTPDNSALLELRSIIRGFLMPRMTAAQRIAISTPSPSTTPHGLMVIQTDEPNAGLWYYYNDGSTYEWRNIINTNPSVSFDGITSGTNTTATMTVGSGASIVPTDGIVRANEFVNSASVSEAVDLNTTEVDGTLPVTNGGTGVSTVIANGLLYGNGTDPLNILAPQNSSYITSTAGGVPQWTALPVGGFLSGSGTANQVAFYDGTNTLTGSNNLTWNGTLLSVTGDLTATGTTTLSGLTTAGIVKNSAAGVLSTGTVDLTTNVNGILPIDNGGTGTSTLPVAGSILYSDGTGYVATDAPADGQILVYNSTLGEWEPSTPASGGSVTSVGLDLPSNVFSISGSPVTTSGTLTGTFIDQDKQKVFAGPVTDPSAPPTFRLLEATDIPNLDAAKITTGILPIARGGTNSGTALNNDRIMVSSGGSIVEAAALTNGQLLIGSTGAAPVAGNITAATGSGVSVTNGAGTIALALTNNESGSAWNTLGNSATTAGTNFIGTTDDVDLTIRTNNTEKMRVTSAGNVGIGVSPTTAKLQISDATTTTDFAGLQINQTGAISGTGYGIYATKTGASTTNVGGYFSATGGTNNYGLLVPSGNVGIGTSAPTQKLEVKDGNVSITNSGTVGELRLFEPSALGSNYTGFKADSQATDITYKLPRTLDTVSMDPESRVLVSSPNGNNSTLSWVSLKAIGGSYMEVSSIDTNYNATSQNSMIIINTAGKIIYLPLASSLPGKVYYVALAPNIGNGWVYRTGSDKICYSTEMNTFELESTSNKESAALFVSDGVSRWYIITTRVQ